MSLPAFNLPPGLRFELRERRYRVRVAQSADEVQLALKLRYRVFCEELGEGLDGAEELGIDRDPFDDQCHHLLLEVQETGELVGTYRLQTHAMAAAGLGWYGSQEFVLDDLQDQVAQQAVELGRACIAPDHRRSQALYLLWRGLARYMLASDARYFFGCCSLTGVDPRAGWICNEKLKQGGFVDPLHHVRVRPEVACEPVEITAAEVDAFEPPALFGTYLRFGTRVASEPALDREFGTTDFLVLFDREAVPQRVLDLIFYTE